MHLKLINSNFEYSIFNHIGSLEISINALYSNLVEDSSTHDYFFALHIKGV